MSLSSSKGEIKQCQPSTLWVDHTGKPGGAELGLGRYLAYDNGLERSLLLIEGGQLAISAQKSGITVTVLGKPTSRWGALRRIWRLWRAQRSSNATVVIANSLRAAIFLSLTKDKKKSYICYLREDLSPARFGRLKRLFILTFVLRRYDGFLANSQWTASTIPSSLSQVPVRVAFPISGIEALQSEVRLTRGYAGGKLRVLSLSRLTRWKGIHVLLEAVRILHQEGYGQNLNVTVAGGDIFDEGGYQKEITSLSEELPEIIHLTGHVDDVAPLLAINDVLVSCSLTPEPFGQVVIQGLAAGLPVIATNQGGPREILSGTGAGILVSPGDPVQLAIELKELILKPELVGQMAGRARLLADSFSDQHLVEQFDESLRALVGEIKKDK